VNAVAAVLVCLVAAWAVGIGPAWTPGGCCWRLPGCFIVQVRVAKSLWNVNTLTSCSCSCSAVCAVA
jgi:hypothetical protein